MCANGRMAAYDNEAEDMERFDFKLAELDANSPWFQEAWRILRTLQGFFLRFSFFGGGGAERGWASAGLRRYQVGGCDTWPPPPP